MEVITVITIIVTSQINNGSHLLLNKSKGADSVPLVYMLAVDGNFYAKVSITAQHCEMLD